MIHKTTRSILSVLLAALLLVTSIPLTPAFADGGTVSPQSESGEGRALEPAADGVYYISSAEELWEFAQRVNNGQIRADANAVLTDDIVLNEKIEVDENGTVTNGDKLDQWTPIGTSSHPYTGTFNGNGHTISGLYLDSSSANYQGLFGCLDQGGTVKNLTLTDSYININSGNRYVGVICGYNDGTIQNCCNSVKATATVTGSSICVGGICGYNNYSGSITSCSNSGTVTGSGSSVTGSGSTANVGGICGENWGSIENCSNSGPVEGSGSIGGICGRNKGGRIENCSNSGDVSGADDYVGGVVGSSSDGISASASVTNCYNTGSVSGNIHVGGVVGYSSGGISASASVTNCYNTGAVSGGEGVGGVVGYNNGGTSASASVTNCYNTGTVTGTRTDDYLGGVVGYNDSGISASASVANCYYLQTADVNKNLSGIGFGGEGEEAIQKTADAFHSGEVAYLLQSKQADGSGQVWGQTLGGEEDSLPTLVALNPGAAKKVYQLTFDWRYEGALEGTTTTTNVYTNGSVTIPEINHDRTGYSISGWKDKNEKPVTAETTVEEDAVFTAEWTANTYTITVTAGSGGAVSGGGTFTENSKVTVTATPATGYHFVNWTENGTEVSTEATFTFNATVDRNLIAIFAKNEDPDPTPTPTPTPDPTPSGPSTGDSTGWDDILDELENTAKGDEITIDMGDETKVPAEIFESLAGQDITLEIALEGGVTWTVNGQDIPADANLDDLDLGVEMDSDGIPVDVVNSITGERDTVQMTLAHDGDFGFTMTLTAPLGAENAGYWANLYHYDEDAEQLTFETAAEIDADGSVSLSLSHASQYAIVIDTHSHATVDVSDLFSDIAPDAWYKDAVQYAYDNGLMTGVSATEFAPEQTTTRAMIVSILARLEGVTTAQAAGFADVNDEWYATAVNWAANVGVVNGYEDNTFRPNTAITREQLAAILMNYAAYKGEDVSNRADLTSYTDQPSTWAEEAISWSVAEGLLTGVTADTLQPQGAATRAQVAAILERFLAQ